MTQDNNAPSCLQSVKTHHPEVHSLLQLVAGAIFAKVEVAVSLDQQLEIQVEKAVTLGVLQRRENKVAFVESTLQEDYLAQHAVNVLLSIWDDTSIFLEKIEHLYRCSILFEYDLTLGARSLCTLTHEHSKDLINRVIEVANLRSNKAITHERFWHLYELFCAALPDLRPEPKPLVDALEVIAIVNPGAAKILYEIQGLLKQSQATAEAFYQEFMSRSNPLFTEFIFTSLLILSQFDFQTVHQRAILLTGSHELVEVKLGIAVLGRLNYSNAERSALLAVTLACFSMFLIQKDAEIVSILTGAYGDLLDQSDEAITKLVELSAHSNLIVRQQVAQVLCYRTEQFFQQDWYKVALFTLLRKPLLHPEILEWLDSVIRRYVNTEPSCAIQAIESLALNWDYINHTDKALPDVVQSTLMELFKHRRDALTAALTQWFASKIPRLHRAATEIEHFFASMPSSNSSDKNDLEPPILLNKSVLNSLDELTLQQMLHRIGGYVVGGGSLAALILSAAQREPISQNLANQIVLLLSDHVIYDYPSEARRYLNNCLNVETLSQVERQIIQAALNRFDRYLQARQSLPLLKELQAPPSRIYAYYQAQWKQNIDIVEQAKERSIFRFMSREIPIKYGKASAHFQSTTQSISEPMRFAPLSYEYEVPQSTLIDPVGRTYQRWQWRLVGVECITDDSETDSKEPEL